MTKMLRQLALFPAAGKKIVKLDVEHRTHMLSDFWWDAINSCCFVTLELFYGFSLFKGGWFVELLFHWELRNVIDGGVLYSAVSTEEALEVLGPASEDRCVVSEEVLSF